MGEQETMADAKFAQEVQDFVEDRMKDTRAFIAGCYGRRPIGRDDDLFGWFNPEDPINKEVYDLVHLVARISARCRILMGVSPEEPAYFNKSRWAVCGHFKAAINKLVEDQMTILESLLCAILDRHDSLTPGIADLGIIAPNTELDCDETIISMNEEIATQVGTARAKSIRRGWSPPSADHFYQDPLSNPRFCTAFTETINMGDELVERTADLWVKLRGRERHHQYLRTLPHVVSTCTRRWNSYRSICFETFRFCRGARFGRVVRQETPLDNPQ